MRHVGEVVVGSTWLWDKVGEAEKGRLKCTNCRCSSNSYLKKKKYINSAILGKKRLVQVYCKKTHIQPLSRGGVRANKVLCETLYDYGKGLDSVCFTHKSFQTEIPALLLYYHSRRSLISPENMFFFGNE